MATDATGTPTSLGIPTYDTAVDAPSGNGNNAQMQAIDALLAARVTKPTGIASGEAMIWNGTGWDRSSVTKLNASNIANGIAASQLSGYPADSTKVLKGDGSWGAESVGTVTLIGAQTLGVDTATLDTSAAGWLNGNIPATYTHLQMVISVRSTKAASFDTMTLQFNGDTGAHYWFGGFYIINAANANAGEFTNTSDTITTAARIGNNVSAASNAAGFFSDFVLDFPLYTKTDRFKTFSYKGHGSGGELVTHGGGQWQGTFAALTKIVFTMAGGNFLAGSYGALYGISG